MLKHYTLGEKLAVFGAIILALIALYRLGVILEIVPEALRPEQLSKYEYQNVKDMLFKRSATQDTTGKAASKVLATLNSIEKTIDEYQQKADKSQEVVVKCDENPLLRWFMTAGEDSDQCVKRNVNTDNRINDSIYGKATRNNSQLDKTAIEKPTSTNPASTPIPSN